jgi:hypothetical protein
MISFLLVLSCFHNWDSCGCTSKSSSIFIVLAHILLHATAKTAKAMMKKSDMIPTDEWRHTGAAKLLRRSETELARPTVGSANRGFTCVCHRIGQTIKPRQEHKVRCPDTSAHCSYSRQYRGPIAQANKRPTREPPIPCGKWSMLGRPHCHRCPTKSCRPNPETPPASQGKPAPNASKADRGFW